VKGRERKWRTGQVKYLEQRPDIEVVRNKVSSVGFDNFLLSPVGEKDYLIKLRQLSQNEKGLIIQSLTENGNILIKEEKFNSIGPAVGNELKNKAFTAIFIVLICIVLYITFAFRRVKNPLNYGLATIIALAHDVLIPTGIYIIWTSFNGGEIDLLFVTALLAILGYSVHDTIVVFDRVRENSLNKNKEMTFEDVVAKSVSETFGRSINTSLTIFLTLLALYFIGGDSTKNFAFILLVGVVAGTYSSIFLASPLLVTLESWRKK
jgi:preprotein translocase subunit SecF